MEISNVSITPPKAIENNYHPEPVYYPQSDFRLLRYDGFELSSQPIQQSKSISVFVPFRY